MGELINQFNNMDTLLQVFWGCSIVASLIFVIQLILTLIGMDHSDITVDFDGSDTMDLGNGINLFSIKNLVNFFLGFGWAGVCLYNSISSSLLLILVAFLIGCAFVGMFIIIYKQTRKLEKNGAFSINDCLGKSASVYIRIPAGCTGKGKVQISIDGSVHEINALTDEDEIASGQNVKIVEIVDHETVKVVNTQYNLVI
ncbi:MAG: serine protease [Bacteroidaceae bacterium]|nr:serine protease [Bacteroidaceae bacterium]